MASFEIRNWVAKAIVQSTNGAIGRGLYKGVSLLHDEITRIAPKDEGISIQTSGVDIDEENGIASVYFVQKYDRRNHENPQFNFQGAREGKFVEKVFLRDGERVRDMIASEIKKELGG